jgi:hypothetical protein
MMRKKRPFYTQRLAITRFRLRARSVSSSQNTDSRAVPRKMTRSKTFQNYFLWQLENTRPQDYLALILDRFLEARY